jgi:VWFA-related protein
MTGSRAPGSGLQATGETTRLGREGRARADTAWSLEPGAWSLLLAALLVFLAALPLIAQGPTPFTVRSRTQLVVQTVTVTDKNGTPIEGLTADDFTVTEDGVAQTISLFEFQKLDDTLLPPFAASPIGPAEAGPHELPGPAEAGPHDRYDNRRLLALYFDMPSLGDAERFRALDAAQRFVHKQMTAADLVAIMTYVDGEVRVRQDFTDDRAALSEVLTALLNGEDLDDWTFSFGQSSGEFNLFNTDRQLAALQTAVMKLAVLEGKKALVDFTSGISLRGVDNQAQLRATLNAARRASVAIFPVDARGLVALSPMGDASQRSPGGLGMYTGATAMATMRGFQRSQDGLYTLAADTGGKALLDYNDLSMGIVQAQRVTTSYYLIGYYPTNTAKDGRLRRVRIALKERPGQLAYREAYYADKEFSRFTASDKERQLEEALMLGDPITELTIAMEVNYFQLNKAEYFIPLAAKIPGSELVLAQKAGAEKTVIDFIGEVRNQYGTLITNMREKVEIRLKGETAARLATSHVQYDYGFTTLPGEYTVKFLARNAETGRIGTYQADFIVPNLNLETERLPISSVVLGSQRVPMSAALFNAGRNTKEREQATNPLVEDGFKLMPSITRVFSRTRDLLVYLQAYERDATVMHPLAAIMTFYRDGEKAFEVPARLITEGLHPTSKAVPIRLAVPLGGLAPGEYTSQLTILDTTGQKAAFWQAPIVVVP